LEYLEWLAESLKLSTPSEWGKVGVQNLHYSGGRTLLSRYGESTYLMLKELYPEYPWQPWTFDRIPQKYWDSLENQRAYMDWIAVTLEIKSMEDWYRLGSRQLVMRKGAGLLEKYDNQLSK
jgi:hypothetical protein